MDWQTYPFPDWSDAGRRVECQWEDGAVSQGILRVVDFFLGEDGDEVPVFALISDAGEEARFPDCTGWRFV